MRRYDPQHFLQLLINCFELPLSLWAAEEWKALLMEQVIEEDGKSGMQGWLFILDLLQTFLEKVEDSLIVDVGCFLYLKEEWHLAPWRHSDLIFLLNL